MAGTRKRSSSRKRNVKRAKTTGKGKGKRKGADSTDRETAAGQGGQANAAKDQGSGAGTADLIEEKAEDKEPEPEPEPEHDTTSNAGRLACLKWVFERVDAYRVAAVNKRKLRDEGIIIPSLTYGEIDFDSFDGVLSTLDIAPGSTFVDIGAGSGRAVLLAASNYPFAHAYGIEIMEDIYQLSLDRLAAVLQRFTPQAKPEFILGDSFAQIEKWASADVLFAPSTCFTREMMDELDTMIPHMKEGAWIITMTQSLKSPCVKLVDMQQRKYGKGKTTVMIYRVRQRDVDVTKYKERDEADARDRDEYLAQRGQHAGRHPKSGKPSTAGADGTGASRVGNTGNTSTPVEGNGDGDGDGDDTQMTSQEGASASSSPSGAPAAILTSPRVKVVAPRRTSGDSSDSEVVPL